MGRISGLPQFSAVNWFLWKSGKRGWRSVLCFLSSLLIPHSSGQGESRLHILGSCGKWCYSSSSLLSSSFHSVLQGLANPLPGHGREIAGFFKAGWTSKLQGYRDLRRWEKIRSTTSKGSLGFTSAFSSAIPEVALEKKGGLLIS